MVRLPGGTFAMGSNDDPTERPVRRQVAAFAIGRHPVTVGEWKACAAAKACDFEPSGDRRACPVLNVSWDDAQQYVAWLAKDDLRKPYRLPTEAEWEYAARAGTTTAYWWGDAVVPEHGELQGLRRAVRRHAARQGRPLPRRTPSASHDMAGSVEQWVADCWHRNYQGAPRRRLRWKPPNCREHVLRGGSWRNDAAYAKVDEPGLLRHGVRYPAHGFRVAR